MVLPSFGYLDHLFKGLQVFLHTVVGAQKGDKIARVHSIKAVKEGIHASVEVDQVDLGHVAWGESQHKTYQPITSCTTLHIGVSRISFAITLSNAQF